ncbi:hypothetical protein BHU72_05070 [Desulfuribacillus stibiiarsenatis]|uniref:Uncharacterized protein n=1 Tax=Desulfuribacillus stibiiarsenatis TaxID=1390249 RepID=A0A1E5L646_9FIRM|nr:flagellar hook-basal body protein [Desulfuribacillus stibiiarsenatis]OEH85459.1 hypothetical protein BHU72_05070 [Desulfuribacillus stibiiarsenatis]
MLRGIYTAAQGMKVQQQRHDITVNNMANINTPGFKGDEAIVRSFPEELLYFMGGQGNAAAPSHSRAASMLPGQAPKVGYLSQGVTIEEVVKRFSQGAIRETGSPMDVAIVDNDPQQTSFFAVKKDLNSNEVFYTRAGNFRLREVEGQQFLATQDGEFVMQRQAGGELTPIQVTSDNVVIRPNGRFEIGDEGFAPLVGNLHIVQMDNQQLPGMLKDGHGLYRISEQFLGAGFQPEIAENMMVRQYYIEGSNVDPMQAMVDMMTAQRAYEANQRVIQAYDRSLEKAVNEVGRV